MNRLFRVVSAGVLTVLVGATAAAADEFLGSYVARISYQDKQASDGYPLDTAAQMVRQDRANFHKFHHSDPDDENNVWFRSNNSALAPGAHARTRRCNELGRPPGDHQ